MTRILVDTSVWVDHLRATDNQLANDLHANSVLMHSLVIGEIACGNLHDRTRVLGRLHGLPKIGELNNDAVIKLIESKELMGRGIGFIDAHLVGAVLTGGDIKLWTRDKRLKTTAEELGIAHLERR